ncbi:Kynurenine 3-monooxygenase [Grifola frondosa]|uniref:Kynurenine 3-monooxygenase n=1 Tax=Grifola frondosa TaxID=5627 RepID=A0A1C7MF44_GRIFR|nr:Kynurenine 3-monooxygenase [Grifola frondosa]
MVSGKFSRCLASDRRGGAPRGLPSKPARGADVNQGAPPLALFHIGAETARLCAFFSLTSWRRAGEALPLQDRAILLGDAAHAMVPFYGQGLNCGLEDVRVLDILLRTANVDPTSPVPEGGEDSRLAGVLAQYSETRHEDLVAISDLAMNNYIEMRHSVTTPAYRIRKALDGILYFFSPKQTIASSIIPTLANETFPATAPTGWLPLYNMVTFRPDISYSTAQRKFSRQTRILELSGWLAAATVGAAVVGITSRSREPRMRDHGDLLYNARAWGASGPGWTFCGIADNF